MSHDPDAYVIDGAIELEPSEARPEREQAPPPTGEETDKRKAVAAHLLGSIGWESETQGFCTCPAKHLHTTIDGEKDCRINIDGTPTIFCLHNSCKGIVAGVNHELRKRLGKQKAEKPAPIVRRLVDLTPASAHDSNTLLGNRFLCRGGGLLFVGYTGIGKSTAVIQLGLHWAIGRLCFGIKPAGPLRVLYYNAENDEGDVCEMRDGVIASLGELNEQERRDFAENFICVFESCRTGQELIDDIQKRMAEHKPDLLILDPVLAYLGADANQQEFVGKFLRNLLNPVLQAHKCAAVVVHHPPKPPKNEQGKKIASDSAYLGAGSAEWANWARAMLSLSAKNDSGLRELKIGKRFRLGWKDADGNPTVTTLLQQSPEGDPMFYRELKGDEAVFASGSVSPTQRVLHFLLPESGESIEKKVLVASIVEAKYAGRDKAKDEIIPLLVHKGYLTEELGPKRRGERAIYLRRTDKTAE